MSIPLACEKKEISSSVPGLSVMTPRECRVDCPFPSHVTRCWVRTAPPTPAVWAWTAYLNPAFWA
jgi:hypothetical protein